MSRPARDQRSGLADLRRAICIQRSGRGQGHGGYVATTAPSNVTTVAPPSVEVTVAPSGTWMTQAFGQYPAGVGSSVQSMAPLHATRAMARRALPVIRRVIGMTSGFRPGRASRITASAIRT